MTSLQQVFTKAQVRWRKLEESNLPDFFVGPAIRETVSTDYEEIDSDRADKGGNG